MLVCFLFALLYIFISGTFPSVCLHACSVYQCMELMWTCLCVFCLPYSTYSYQEHSLVCVYMLVVCTKCNSNVLRRYFEQHQGVCPARQILCQHCGREMPLSMMQVIYLKEGNICTECIVLSLPRHMCMVSNLRPVLCKTEIGGLHCGSYLRCGKMSIGL